MIPGISPSQNEQLLTVFRHRPEVERVVLFGSRAKGNFKPGSDIDLAIYLEPALDLSTWLDFANQIDELDFPQKVDLINAERIQNEELKEHIRRVGVLIFERENTVSL